MDTSNNGERLIKFNEPYITGNELGYIEQCFINNHFQGNGEFTKKVQRFLEDYLNVPKVLLTDSCTSALEISALLAKCSPDDEVILPSYTFSSTASAFARAGYKIRFADVTAPSMMVSVETIEPLITENTRVIVPVHYAGIPCDIVGLQQLAHDRGIWLVEDAAQALGTTKESKPLGTFGKLGCLSFHETKNLHAGLAGALLINDESLINRATYIWERGTNRQAVLNGLTDKYTWVEVGGSFYPSELQAAFLLAQLESIENNMAERKPLFDCYSQKMRELKPIFGIDFPEVGSGITPNYHAFFVVFRDYEQCEFVRKFLVSNKVYAYIGYVPLHSSPVGQSLGYQSIDVPETEKFAKRILRMPMHNNLSIDDITYVCDLVKVGLSKYG